MAVVFFGGLLALAQAAEEPLDDPDPAFQRPGFLDVGDLPAPAPDLRVDMTVTGTPTVVLFERSDRPACVSGNSPDKVGFCTDLQEKVPCSMSHTLHSNVRKIGRM